MPGKLIPERNEIADDHKWDLTPLFESDELWEGMFAAVEADLSSYDKYRGRLKDSVTYFKEALGVGC